MFVQFDVLSMLFWVIISTLLPGAVMAFSIFRKSDFLFIEKLLMGFGIGFVLLPLIPLLLNFLLGLTYTALLGYASVALLYVVAIILAYHYKVYEDISSFKLPFLGSSVNPADAGGESESSVVAFTIAGFRLQKSHLISFTLLFILILSFWIRMSAYSPVFQELDPYYYLYGTQQILIQGYLPSNDLTAWYPEAQVNHRQIPLTSYTEAVWYSLYTGGAGPNSYNNLLLACVASVYPPVCALLMLFFIYLLISTAGRREWGLLAAFLLAFTPVLLLKLSAGEFEATPYNFFSLAFFFAMYALAIRKNDIRFSLLAGLALAAVALGSNVFILAAGTFAIYSVVQGTLLFLKREDEKELKSLIITNTIVLVIGGIFAEMLVMGLFNYLLIYWQSVVPFLISTLAVGVFYLLRSYVPDMKNQTGRWAALGGLMLLGILLYSLTPAGQFIKEMVGSGVGVAEYKMPLDRTIAEQGLAGNYLGGEFGFVASNPSEAITTLFGPLRWLLSLVPQLLDPLQGLFTTVFGLILVPFSLLANAGIALTFKILGTLSGTTTEFTPKADSFLLFWVLLFWVALLYSLYRFFTSEHEDNNFILFLAIVIPTLTVGIIKSKYLIFAGFMLMIGIAFVFCVAEALISAYARSEESKKKAINYLLGFAVVLMLLQFAFHGTGSAYAWGSVQIRFQDNPTALVPKFQQFCQESNDPLICNVAKDPMAYANQGTNYQYNQYLCALSLVSNYTGAADLNKAQPWETQTVYYRCQRISNYWIDSMEWIRKNIPENGTYVISWWDYGHWINFFGQRGSVLRNEHVSHKMIGEVADRYLDATPEELSTYMKAHSSKYALFDVELIASGNALGGKYGALNYLSCAYHNETSVANWPGASRCEADHLWETIFVPQSPRPCTISSITGATGVIAYHAYTGTYQSPFYPSECQGNNLKIPQYAAYCRDKVSMKPAYCIGNVTLANGRSVYGTHYLNETYPNGDLKLNKALIDLPAGIPNTYHLGNATMVTLLYTEDLIWFENGQVKSGYEDRKGKFYDSNLYRAIFLNRIPGFDLVYTSEGGAVKIFKIKE